jgi:hypothetical protein
MRTVFYKLGQFRGATCVYTNSLMLAPLSPATCFKETALRFRLIFSAWLVEFHDRMRLQLRKSGYCWVHCASPDERRIWRIGRMTSDRERPKYSENNLFQCYFIHSSRTWNAVGQKDRFRFEKSEMSQPYISRAILNQNYVINSKLNTLFWTIC